MTKSILTFVDETRRKCWWLTKSQFFLYKLVCTSLVECCLVLYLSLLHYLRCCHFTMVVLWGIVVPHIAHASLCDAVDSSPCVTTTDPFSIMEEKSDESQFYQNMTIYLKTRKMVSQWTK